MLVKGIEYFVPGIHNIPQNTQKQERRVLSGLENGAPVNRLPAEEKPLKHGLSVGGEVVVARVA